jgi:hypothetical protein
MTEQAALSQAPYLASRIANAGSNPALPATFLEKP